MKKCRNILLVVLTICVITTLLTGCEAAQTEVPEAVLYDLVEENEYSDLGECKLSVIHHVDEKSHRDSVDLILGVYAPYAELVFTSSAVYEYDRSSDLWVLLQHDGWSDPDYNFSFNDELVGTWTLNNNESVYEITVTDVYPEQISLEFSITESIYGGLGENYTWKISGYGTYDLNGAYFEIPLELPEECYVSWKDTKSGENESITYLNVWISPTAGITRAYISPTIRVW